MPSGLDILAWPFGYLVDGALTLGLGAAGAICLCVAVVRCLLFGLSAHQARSHWVLARIRPQIAELHERHLTDPQGARAQLVELYATHRISPFGPILVIIPQALVLVGLYWALRPHFGDLSGVGFLGDLNAHATATPVGVGLIVGYVAGFCASMWISARRASADMSRFTYALMAAIPAGALLAWPIMTVGMALYLFATAATTLAQAVVLWRMFPRRPDADTDVGDPAAVGA